MKKLIIGKNSSVVKNLKIDGQIESSKIKLISHKNIDNVNFDLFSIIWLFSWSKKSWKENLEILLKLPIKKVVFISSHSVFSFQKFEQPFRYVINKLKAEEFVLKNGGCVVRIASIDHKISSRFQKYAFTNTESLLELIKSKNSLEDFPKISNFFELFVMPPKKSNWAKQLICRLQYFRCFKFINLLHAIIAKFFLKNIPYGYTKDANDFVANKAFIGFGCLSSFAFKNRVTDNDTIFVSNRNDFKIESAGFNGTFLGLSKGGLSSRWHGVSTELIKNNYVKKTVAIFPFRAKAKGTKNICYERVQKIFHNGKLWEIFTDKGKKHFANQIILGAGWFENIRLLSCLEPISATLADDESAIIGTVSLKEAIESKLIRKKFIFVLADNGFYFSHKFFPAFIEVRLPLAHGKTSDIFNDRPLKIIWHILTSLSISKINNAFFNKFGFGLSLNSRLNVFITILNPNSTKVTAKKGEIIKWRRNRIAMEMIEKVNADLLKKFKNYSPLDDVEFIDGMHYSGGLSKSSNIINRFISKNTLHILGVPNRKKMHPFHNTLSLMHEYRDKYS